MTGTEGPAPERPLSLELLADLHAGVLDAPDADEVRRRVETQPAAQEALAALDATVADLRAAGSLAMPADVAARLDAAIAAEVAASRPVPVVDLSTRRRRRGWAGAGLLAAAAAAAGVVALGTGPIETAGTPRAENPPLALAGDDLGGGLDDALGATDYGPLSRPAALRACLQANGVTLAGEPLGAREVTLDGQPGVLLVLPTGQIARFRLLVVGADCGPGNPSLIASDTVGR